MHGGPPGGELFEATNIGTVGAVRSVRAVRAVERTVDCEAVAGRHQHGDGYNFARQLSHVGFVCPLTMVVKESTHTGRR